MSNHCETCGHFKAGRPEDAPGWCSENGLSTWPYEETCEDYELREPETQMNGAERIAAERNRQIVEEGWDAEHDADHVGGSLSIAAACYAVAGLENVAVVRPGSVDAWPWVSKWDKRMKHNRIRRLEIAGALIAAEIDRFLCLEEGEEA